MQALPFPNTKPLYEGEKYCPICLLTGTMTLLKSFTAVDFFTCSIHGLFKMVSDGE